MQGAAQGIVAEFEISELVRSQIGGRGVPEVRITATAGALMEQAGVAPIVAVESRAVSKEEDALDRLIPGVPTMFAATISAASIIVERSAGTLERLDPDCLQRHLHQRGRGRSAGVSKQAHPEQVRHRRHTRHPDGQRRAGRHRPGGLVVADVRIDRFVLTHADATDILTHIASVNASKEEHDMNQLTVRGFDDELSAILRRLAKQEGISLNQAALRLLKKGAGLTDKNEGNPNAIGTSLDDLFGAWSCDEAESFDAALEVFETVDEASWS